MLVNGKQYRTIWLSENQKTVFIIDQRKLPFEFEIEEIKTVKEMAVAIKDMHLRGAGLIGAAAGFGMYLAVLESGELEKAANLLKATRPTAVNLAYAVDLMLEKLKDISPEKRLNRALELAQEIANNDAEQCKAIGRHGVQLIESISKAKQGQRVNILTHCNAGWLAFVDYGSALSPIYEAHRRGIDVHVYVDETRPRNQGARLTAWELGQQGVPYTLIADNVGGHLMQHAKVDMVIVGADRVAANGDAANKIGTYLKALAANDNGVPFYVAFPSTTRDMNIRNGVRDIEIEERSGNEVIRIEGQFQNKIIEVQLCPENSHAVNYGFDVTPARLISAWITDEGVEWNKM
ncbi:MAG: S-methyl-5-thioribose-1-phosphate isomerase [Bacteroidetes bacterium]|nr:MAG: S-methyl-5-thioribose-1-phosphate isomerase [Bacteroidota bacterium]